MATEALYIPEEHLADVIRVLRAGLDHLPDITDDVRAPLLQWCENEEAYLGRSTGKPASKGRRSRT